MSKYVKTTIILFLLAAFCWILSIVLPSASLQLWLALFATAFSIAFLGFLAITISQKTNKNLSPYRLFAIVDGIIGLCIVAYALYDILTDTGWFAGLTGLLLLIFAVPIVVILLLADYLVWKFRKKK